MPDFLFAAKDGLGNAIQGTVTAVDMTDAVRQIAGMGYTLTQVQAADEKPSYSGVSPEPTQTITTGGAAMPTQAMPMRPPASEPTRAIDPATSQATQDLLLADASKRRKVEADLAKLGMSPVEIRRLLDAKATTYDPDTASPPPTTAPTTAPVAARKQSNRVTTASLESFAAELTSANATKTNAAVRSVSLNLPEFRESSVEETRQAEALLRDASMLRRREKFREAEAKCREALAFVPKDAAALELLGDLLQGVARIDEALAAYRRAVEADPKRSSAEKKYGDLLMRQQNWNLGGSDAAPPNPWANLLLSLFLPGTGQAINGEWPKAIAFFVVDLLCLYSLLWSPWSIDTRHRGQGLGAMVVGTVSLIVATILVATWDSMTVARKQHQER